MKQNKMNCNVKNFLICTCIFASLNSFISCKKQKSMVTEVKTVPVVIELSPQQENSAPAQKNSKETKESKEKKESSQEKTRLKIINNTERKLIKIELVQKNKIPFIVYQEIGKNNFYEADILRGSPYKISVWDEKNHCYTKFEDFTTFDTENAVLTFKDSDFKPDSSKDLVMKFFGN